MKLLIFTKSLNYWQKILLITWTFSKLLTWVGQAHNLIKNILAKKLSIHHREVYNKIPSFFLQSKEEMLMLQLRIHFRKKRRVVLSSLQGNNHQIQMIFWIRFQVQIKIPIRRIKVVAMIYLTLISCRKVIEKLKS